MFSANRTQEIKSAEEKKESSLIKDSWKVKHEKNNIKVQVIKLFIDKNEKSQNFSANLFDEEIKPIHDFLYEIYGNNKKEADGTVERKMPVAIAALKFSLGEFFKNSVDAKATRLLIDIISKDGKTTVCITDDGTGFGEKVKDITVLNNVVIETGIKYDFNIQIADQKNAVSTKKEKKNGDLGGQGLGIAGLASTLKKFKVDLYITNLFKKNPTSTSTAIEFSCENTNVVSETHYLDTLKGSKTEKKAVSLIGLSENSLLKKRADREAKKLAETHPHQPEQQSSPLKKTFFFPATMELPKSLEDSSTSQDQAQNKL